MTVTLTRSPRLFLTATAALALTALTALPASAATTPAAPRVSLPEAAASLPSPTTLPPGNVTGFHKTIVPKPTGLSPCGLAATSVRLDLHDNGAAVGTYSTPAGTPDAKLAQWVVATRVYASTTAAHQSVARLGVVIGKCPAVGKAKTVNGMTITRTWSAHYVSGSWHGYQTVDVIKLGGQAPALRHIAVYLQRGNALIQVDEIATVVGHNSTEQQNRRRAVQTALQARLVTAAQD
jgi:hypothetical protein